MSLKHVQCKHGWSMFQSFISCYVFGPSLHVLLRFRSTARSVIAHTMVFSALCLSALMVRANGDSSFTVHSYESTDCTGDATTTSESLAEVMTRMGNPSSNNCYWVSATTSQNDAATDCSFQVFESTDCTGTVLRNSTFFETRGSRLRYASEFCQSSSTESGSFQVPTCASVTSVTTGGDSSATKMLAVVPFFAVAIGTMV